MPFARTRICQSCYRGHLDGLNVLSTGAHPKECSECHTSYQALRDRAGLQPEDVATMDCHNEDGIYRFMCRKCSRAYVRKRAELYGPTEFGHKLGLS